MIQGLGHSMIPLVYAEEKGAPEGRGQEGLY